MTLREFIEEYVRPNTLIRLWTIGEGCTHNMIRRGDSCVCMEHEIISGKHWMSKYADTLVIGVTDIVVDDFYREAVNIVIEGGMENGSI